MAKIYRRIIDNGGEVDYTHNYIKKGRTGKGRVSLRKKDGRYQIYVKWTIDRHKEEIIYSSKDLRDCIEYGNYLFGLNDVLVEG